MIRKLILSLCLSSPAFAQVYLESRSGVLIQADAAVPGFSGRRASATAFHGGSDQQFELMPLSADTVAICLATGECLTVEGGTVETGAPVGLALFTGVEGQVWALEPSTVAPGYSRIRSKLGTYLDSLWSGDRVGLPLWTWDASTTDSQLWRTLEPLTASLTQVPAHCPHSESYGHVGDESTFDFGGAPWISAEARLHISADRTRIIATTTMDAFRHGVAIAPHLGGSWTDTVFSAPAGRLISRMQANVVSTVGFLGPSAGGEFLLCGDGAIVTGAPSSGPVSSFEFIGDTGGNDASADEDCGCDSQFRGAQFHPIFIALE